MHYIRLLGGYLIGDLAKQEKAATLPAIYWRLEEDFFDQLARFVIAGKTIQHQAIMSTTHDEAAAFAATRFLAGSQVNNDAFLTIFS